MLAAAFAVVSAAAPLSVEAQTIGTAAIPSGFGLYGGVMALSASVSYAERERTGPNPTHWDASVAASAGFGNPVSGLGVDFGVNITSTRNFGESGYLSLGTSRLFQVSEGVVGGVALRADYLAPWGDISAVDPTYSLVSSFLGASGGTPYMVSVGIGTGWNQNATARDVRGAIGFGMNVAPDWAVSVGYVGEESIIGAVWEPGFLQSTSVAFSVRNLEGDNTVVGIDVGRAFSLMR